MRQSGLSAMGRLAAAFLFLWAAGCTIKNKGTARQNQPPVVSFSPAPVENTIFTATGEFFWFASDPDGFIVEFQYSVQLDSVVRAQVRDSSGKPAGTPVDFIARHNPETDPIWQWVSVSNLFVNGRRREIDLPALRRVNDTVRSFIFLRAKDDQGAFSNIAWRRFGRINHSPKTHLGTVNGGDASGVFWSLDRRTDSLQVGHTGITITWFGSDSLDFPGLQPKFQYFWELFGPLGRLEFDTSQSRLFTNSERATGQKFTAATAQTFFGLKGQDSATNFKTGDYIFKVAARDDAGALDSLGTFVRLTVIRPRFDKKILLIRKKTGVNPFPMGEPAEGGKDSTQGYYVDLIRQAGYGAGFDSAQDVYTFSEAQELPESLLARYRLVIYHKEELRRAAGPTFSQSLRNYMNAGGSVWGLGRDDLTDLSGKALQLGPGLNFFNEDEPNSGFPHFFFGINALNSDNHVLRILSGDSVSNEEFIGAEPAGQFVPDFPLLRVDTNVVKTFLAFPWRKPVTPCSCYVRMPGVNFFQRDVVLSEPLYFFISPFDTSKQKGKVVAVRAQRKGFRTAFFGFSLYGIEKPEAVAVTRKMLEWFLGPPGAP